MAQTRPVNDELDLLIHGRFANDEIEVKLHRRYELSHAARLASVLIERWGMVAGVDDGEDTAGRAKLRLQTPEDVVTRACETAERAITEFKARGWLCPMPSYEELKDGFQESEKAD